MNQAPIFEIANPGAYVTDAAVNAVADMLLSMIDDDESEPNGGQAA